MSILLLSRWAFCLPRYLFEISARWFMSLSVRCFFFFFPSCELGFFGRSLRSPSPCPGIGLGGGGVGRPRPPARFPHTFLPSLCTTSPRTQDPSLKPIFPAAARFKGKPSRETDLFAKTLHNQLSIIFFSFLPLQANFGRPQQIPDDRAKWKFDSALFIVPSQSKATTIYMREGGFPPPSSEDFNLKAQRKEPLSGCPQFADGTGETILLGLAGLSTLRFNSPPMH